MKFRLWPKGAGQWKSATLRMVIILLLAILVPFVAVFWFTYMPGTTFQGEIPVPVEAEETVLPAVQQHVLVLAGEIGERNLSRPDKLEAAAAYIEAQFDAMGCEVKSLPYDVDGATVRNLEVTLPGKELADELIVVGAHYDTFWGTPGADDNASGVAALIELGRLLKDKSLSRTVRLVAFANEEPPHFHNDSMGSLVYARQCSERGDNVVGMIALEMLGYYDDAEGSQAFPPLLSAFYPHTGNFLAFVGNIGSRRLLHESIRVFRETTDMPSEGLSGPTFISGVDFSDHWSFWQCDFPAIMVTDTAFFRNENYHEPTDTPDTLDYVRLARATVGIAEVVEHLAGDSF